MKILNDENREQVQAIVFHAVGNSILIESTTNELRTLRASVAHHEEVLRKAELDRTRFNQKLNEIGFHDIGHARTELGQ